MRFVVIALVLTLAAVPVVAQTPNVMVYFDDALTAGSGDCPSAAPGTVMDTLYVVANNFNTYIKSIEFSVDIPSELLWLSDVMNPGSVGFGATPGGIAIGYGQLACFNSTVLCRILVLWECDTCQGHENTPLVVGPDPRTGYLRAVRWPDEFLFSPVGMTSLVCATVPVEETTWGQVKALFSE